MDTGIAVYLEGWDAHAINAPLTDIPYRPNSKNAKAYREGWLARDAAMNTSLPQTADTVH